RLEDGGVVRREIGRGADGLINVEELETMLGPRTRVVAVTWVDSFTGITDDISTIGAVCRAKGVWCVVNGTQAVGARTVDVGTLGVDAVTSCGYKWLCGPYGTGFTWLAPDLLDSLTPQQAYWLAHGAGSDLEHTRNHSLRHDLGARAFDVFGTANFLTFEPWLAALDLISEIGPQQIAAHNQRLVDRLITGLDVERYRVRGARTAPARSTLVVLERRDGTAEEMHRRLAGEEIATSLREGGIRLAPHLFNTEDQVDHALTVLHT
ncbi:MAG: aminotransferase class V-fold PLP-dependent enzyme, partial [Propionibacteriales bacterium]|nr:aminotransferase class V-fold PLP-dependent enzyme [Propionibacteriales bacterium]